MFYENFTNLNEEVKTIKIGLKPIGKTEEWIKSEERDIINKQLVIDEKLEECKKTLDQVYRNEVNKRLSQIDPSIADGLYDIWVKCEKEKKKKNFFNEKTFKSIQKEIVEKLKEIGPKTTKPTKIFKNFVEFSGGDCELENRIRYIATEFKDRTAYFDEYVETKNPIISEAKSGSFTYRILNENLVIFYKNVWKFTNAINPSLNDEQRKKLSMIGFDVIMNPNNVLKYILQSDIDTYNNIISQYMSLSNEWCTKEAELALPKLERLYKQILSESESKVQKLSNDEDVLKMIEELCEPIVAIADDAKSLFAGIGSQYDKYSVLIHKKVDANNDDFSHISKKCCGSWDGIKNTILDKWKADNPNRAKQDEKAKKFLNQMDYLSVGELDDLISFYYGNKNSATQYLNAFGEHSTSHKQYPDWASLVKNNYLLFKESYETSIDKNLKSDENSNNISTLFDSLKGFEKFLSQVYVSDESCGEFYDRLETIKATTKTINSQYNRVRNYLTKKDYIRNNFRINFGLNASLFRGWTCDEDGNYQYFGMFFKGGDDDFYVGILNKSIYGRKINNNTCKDAQFKYLNVTNYSDGKRSMAKYFKEHNITTPETLEELYEKVNSDEFQKSFPHFKPQSIDQYEKMEDIYKAFESRVMKWVGCSREVVDKMVEDGEMYLFKLTCRDMSEKSKGKPQLFTMYLRALLGDEDVDRRYFIAGNAEIRFRPRTIVDGSNKSNFVVHKANYPIPNKSNINAQGSTATYPYDITKNKRFTLDSWCLHLPIDINAAKKRKTKDEKIKLQTELNSTVNRLIYSGEINHIIGVDRGERNLLTVSVINMATNKIVEQKSLNIISNTDYNRLLSDKEGEIKNQKKNWQQMDSIKNIAEGYVSHAVNEIVKLVKKYNAIIAIENLNLQFKRSRCKILKNVYVKFENQLSSKLAFLVDKNLDKNEPGGLFNPVTLALRDSNYKQNGIIFSVMPNYTSNIDPVTGFANVIEFNKVTTISKIKSLFNSFDAIRYNQEKDRFEFVLDYKNFTLKGKLTATDLNKTKWILTSTGARIVKRKETNTSFYKQVEMEPTEELKQLLGKVGENFMTCNIKNVIMNQTSLPILEEFLKILKMVLQMRNSKSGTDVDYILSPALTEDGNQFDSRQTYADPMPVDADTNGAYNIARRAAMLLEQVKDCCEKLEDNNALWLNFVQSPSNMRTLVNETGANVVMDTSNNVDYKHFNSDEPCESYVTRGAIK